MTEYSNVKVRTIHRYRKTTLILPFLRLFLRNFLSMNFFKFIEFSLLLDRLQKSGDDVREVCDSACGCGEYSDRLLKKGYNVIATDLDQRSLEIAKYLFGNVDLIRANSEKLPLQALIFDAIISACALEHFEDDRAALNEFYRVLKPDGSLILTADSLTYPVPRRIKDRHRVKNFVVNYYLLPDLVAKIEGSGFVILEAKYFLNSPLSVLFFKISVTNPYINVMLFPMALPLAIVSDLLFGNPHEGIFLIVHAKKL